jgi:hypothetical protein
MTTSYIFEPSNATDNEFFIGAGKLYKFIKANINKLTIPKDWFDDNVTPAHLNWETANDNYQDPDNRTKLITAEKNETKKIYAPLLTQEIEALRFDPYVTDAQLRNLDIFKQPHSTHPVPVTDKIPELKVELHVIRRINVHFKSQGEISKAKPHGVHAARFAWGFMEQKPDNISQLDNIDVGTRSPFTLDFDEHERGKMIYICAAWEMNNGELGQWSEIIHAIVP